MRETYDSNEVSHSISGNNLKKDISNSHFQQLLTNKIEKFAHGMGLGIKSGDYKTRILYTPSMSQSMKKSDGWQTPINSKNLNTFCTCLNSIILFSHVSQLHSQFTNVRKVKLCFFLVLRNFPF